MRYRVTYLVTGTMNINPEYYKYISNPEDPLSCVKSDIEAYEQGGMLLEELLPMEPEEISVKELSLIVEGGE